MCFIDPASRDDTEGLPAMGTTSEVTASLSHFNIGSDGAPPGKNAGLGTVLMHGPGMVVEMAPMGNEVRQIMITMTDEDFAFPVLMRMCKANKWTMLDPESGRRLG